LPSPGNLLQWQSVVAFVSEPAPAPAVVELRGEVFPVYLDKLPPALRAQPTLCPHLPVDIRWMLDTVVLQADVLAELAPGDVICVSPERGTLYAGPIPIFSFYLQDECLMLEDTKDQAAPDNANGGAEARSLDLQALPVTVSFVLGKRTMSVADISSLYPGMTISLDHVSPRVDVMAGGAVLASGELVRIGETLGVEINTLAPAIGGEPVNSP